MWPSSPDGWSLVAEGFDPATFQAWESLFTLGSGYLHVRGSLEEPLGDSPQNVEFVRTPTNVTSERFRAATSKWGTYIPGIYGPHPLLNNELINLPYFLWTTIHVNGQQLGVDLREALREQRRELRLDTATLARHALFAGPDGRLIHVQFERLISAARPHLCVDRFRLSCEHAARVDVHMGIDADVRTNGHDHFRAVELAQRDEGELSGWVQTDAGDVVEILVSARGDGGFGVGRNSDNARDAGLGQRTAERFSALAIGARIEPGSSLTVERRTALTTSRDLRPATPRAVLGAAEEFTFEQLHSEHAAVWRQRWEACDVVVEGDREAQLALRVALYHLLRSHVDDARVAIDAKGYSGDAYWGRFFWDTELFLLPFFAYTQPELARTLVEFRVRTLPGAMENARRMGYPGARCAWESDADGRECCPNWQYADHEIHVTADVVYGLAHYAAARGDDAYLRGAAARVIVETARYWLARVDWRDSGNQRTPVLLGVMGPDEYTPISSNNAFTSRMVRFALELAARVGDAGGASDSERSAFADVAAGLPVPRDPHDPSLVLQCEEFPGLAELPFERYWKDREKPLAAQVTQERLYRSKCLKQADVLMLMALFPQEFSDVEVARAWDYYVPYTTHDSSLSPGVHAIVACRLKKWDEAWHLWRRACATDLDVTRGGAREGMHIANCGAIWQMAVFGFAGMRTALQSDTLTLWPQLPATWTRLAFPLAWKGCRLAVQVGGGGATVANRGPQPLDVEVWNQRQTVDAGAVAIWRRNCGH